MASKYILLVIIVLCWTVNPFLKKIVSKKFKPSEFMLINHFVISSMMMTYLGYLLYKKEFTFTCVKKLDKKDIMYLIIGSITTVVGSLFLIKLLAEHEASYIIPHLQPIVIILTVFLGFLLFKEDVSKNKILGVFLIISGLGLMNYKSKK